MGSPWEAHGYKLGMPMTNPCSILHYLEQAVDSVAEVGWDLAAVMAAAVAVAVAVAGVGHRTVFKGGCVN